MHSEKRENGPLNTAGKNRSGLRSSSRGPMTLDEARQVPWLRSKPKLLGDLLDEGYLDRSRLEWAAKKAYDPRLKEAAQVILDWLAGRSGGWFGDGNVQRTREQAEAPIRVGISLEEARSTTWPFSPFRGQPMGTLSDTRQLSLKDLAYAVDNARDDRVRRAAIVLMLARLDQELEEPPRPTGALRVVAARRSFAERRQLSLALLEGSIFGGSFAVALVLLIGTLTRERPNSATRLTLAEALASPELTAALFVVLLGLAGVLLLAFLVFDRIIKRLDDQIEGYRKGEEGEERVVEKARRALNGDWTLFRNVVLPGRRKADLDIVLVGPPGVWALEVKTLSGEHRNIGETWQYRAGSRWKQMARSPSRQARDGAIALKEFLKADGIRTFVPAVVAWAEQGAGLSVEDPTVPVWTIDRVEDELGNLWNGKQLTEAEHDRIVEKLTRLCQAPGKGAW